MAYTDFDDLTNLTTDATPESALPCNLADDVLQLISNDLKQVALCRTTTLDAYPRRTNTIHLLSRLILPKLKHITGEEKYEMSWERIDHLMERFQYYVEREILSRANGTSSQADTEQLLAELEDEVFPSPYEALRLALRGSESSVSGSCPRG